MQVPLPPNRTKRRQLDVMSPPTVSSTGQVEIGGKRFFTGPRVSAMLGISQRTLQRWGAGRIGPGARNVFKDE
jgi:hypothetical protein